MAKIIFLFEILKKKDSFLEDLEVTEEFLTNEEEMDKLGYDANVLAKAYAEASEIYKFGY